jgi:hypothetical protein
MLLHFSRAALLPCLLTALACSNAPDTETNNDRNTVVDGDRSDDTEDPDDEPDELVDAGKTQSKSDAGRAEPKADAGRSPVAADAGSKLDAGKADAGEGTSKLDAGKSDAGEGTSKLDAGKSDAGPDEPPFSGDKLKPKCMKKDSDLLVVGDSYINWPATHTFPQDMIEASGGQVWRMEAVGGFSMATGGLGSIPATFEAAIAADPSSHSVLMSGGGNDILVAGLADAFGQCKTDASPTVPHCQKIVADAIAAADGMMERAVTANIRDVIYFFYPHVPNGTALGGPNPNAILDYALPKVRDFCNGVEKKSAGKVRCHFVDLVPVFEGKSEAEYFFPGDIHPTSKGSKLMAEAVWTKMKEVCVGQKEASGCCEP